MNRGRSNSNYRRTSPTDRSMASGGRPGGRGHSDSGKKRNWFARHKIVTGVLTVLVVALVGIGGWGLYTKYNAVNILTGGHPSSIPTNLSTDAPDTTAPDLSTDGATPTGADASPTEPEDTPPDYVFQNDTINILVLGTDLDSARLQSGKGETLTDCIILVSINVKTKQASMVSIPRDTYVRIYNDKNHQVDANRINSAFAYGGKMNDKNKAILYAENTVNQFLAKGKIPIDHYVLFNMDFVRDLIDAVGGVDVPVNNLSDSTLTIKGDHGTFTYQNNTTMHMSGNMALTYARDRHHTSGGDLGREMHQQDVIKALLKDMQGKNIIKMIPALFSQFQKELFTDISDPTYILSLAWVAKDMSMDSIAQYQISGTSFGMDGASMLVADQQHKAEVVQKVFGISNTADGSWTKSSLQAQINKKLAAGKAIVNTANSFLSNYSGYYSDDEVAALRGAISDYNTATSHNDTDGAAAAQEEVQSAYDAISGTVIPRKQAIDTGSSKINWAKGKLEEYKDYFDANPGDRAAINSKINVVQGCVDSMDWNNVGAATSDLVSTASPFFDNAAASVPTPSAT